MNRKRTQTKTTGISRSPSLDEIFLRRLSQLLGPLDGPSKLLRFPVVFERLGAVFCLTKAEGWQVLRHLEARGYLQIVPYQGIRLLERTAASVAPSSTPPASESVPYSGRSKARILKYLKKVGEAYPSDVASALDLDLDTVVAAARVLVREGRVEV